MPNASSMIRRALAVAVGPALLFVLGCSDDGVGTRYSVSGTVTYNDKPVEKADISFVPKGNGQGARGEVLDGKFSSLTTVTPGDGVLEGEYIVTLTAKDVDTAQITAESDAMAKKHGLGKMTITPPELVAKAGNQAKSSIPKRYQYPGNSDLTAKVSSSSRQFDLKLHD